MHNEGLICRVVCEGVSVEEPVRIWVAGLQSAIFIFIFVKFFAEYTRFRLQNLPQLKQNLLDFDTAPKSEQALSIFD
jgi:hypothetical protein